MTIVIWLKPCAGNIALDKLRPCTSVCDTLRQLLWRSQVTRQEEEENTRAQLHSCLYQTYRLFQMKLTRLMIARLKRKLSDEDPPRPLPEATLPGFFHPNLGFRFGRG